MDHGPDVYRTVDSEEMQLLASFSLRTQFPKDVKREGHPPYTIGSL